MQLVKKTIRDANKLNRLTATDEYTRLSVYATQPYTGTTADYQLVPRQN